MNELAKRAVACKRWRWLEGMAIHDQKTNRKWRVLSAPNCWVYANAAMESHTPLYAYRLAKSHLPNGFARAIAEGPCLDDAATVGAILSLVIACYPDGFTIGKQRRPFAGFETERFLPDQTSIWTHSTTFAEALVAALEAAP